MLQINQNYYNNVVTIKFIIMLLFSIALQAQDEVDELLQSFKNGYEPVGQKAFLITRREEKAITCYNNQNAHALILYTIYQQFISGIKSQRRLKRPLDNQGAENPHYFDDLISCLDIYDTFSHPNNPGMFNEESIKDSSKKFKTTYVQKLCNGDYNSCPPLHYVVENHTNFDYGQFLIDHGADVNKLDPTGQYATLDIARRNNYYSDIRRNIIVEGLLKNGAKAARIRTIDFLINTRFIKKINSNDLELGKLQLRSINKSITTDEFTAKKSRYK